MPSFTPLNVRKQHTTSFIFLPRANLFQRLPFERGSFTANRRESSQKITTVIVSANGPKVPFTDGRVTCVAFSLLLGVKTLDLFRQFSPSLFCTLPSVDEFGSPAHLFVKDGSRSPESYCEKMRFYCRSVHRKKAGSRAHVDSERRV